jgi:two-component system sensor histidine kinase ChiS
VELGDHVQKDLTVLFCDIREFTTLSEKMSPHENFNFLNSYLKRVSPVIKQNEGVIDKYIGDAIMALFSSPENALDASIGMQEALQVYNKHRKSSGFKPIRIGIGLNSGSLMLGTVGEKNRMDTTVISDSVNLASRLEELTKTYKSGILISEETFRGIKNIEKYHYRCLDVLQVKGREKAVRVIEILEGLPKDEYESKISTCDDFNIGSDFWFEKQNMDKAREIFDKLLHDNPDDLAVKIFRDRIYHYILEQTML